MLVRQHGIEPTIHTLRYIYKDDNTEALLLVDAEKAFNVLNQNAALHNISILYIALLCQSYSRIPMGEHQISMSVERSWPWMKETRRETPGNEYVRSGHNATNT